ncbi:MAG: hypothetical protein ACJ8CB_35540 [Ktedonobacteraceae bacterium]
MSNAIQATGIAVISQSVRYFFQQVTFLEEGVPLYKVMDVLKQANVSISSNPHISLVVQGRYDQEPVRRGITRAKQLWRHGINVFSSQDDVADPFYRC